MVQITMNDLLSQETRRHPLAFSAHLREQGSLVSFNDDVLSMGKAWIVTAYDDAMTLLKDPRFIKGKPLSDGEGSSELCPQTPGRLLSWRRDMLNTNPPDHTRLRHLVSKAFTSRMIEQLRPRVQQITDDLLDAVQDQGQMDLIADFALPLPMTVISEMLGIPLADQKPFRSWTQTLLTAVGNPEQEVAALPTQEAFVQYIRTLLAEKRAHPDISLTSNLVQAEEQGDRLSEIELISMIWLLIVAGHETTVNLIGTGVLALLEHPEQLYLLQHHPSILPAAIEELLRAVNPVMYVSRYASEDVPLHGKVIHKGELVMVALIGANSDPHQFPDPDRLDITREERQHLAFGKGIHTCLGAPLARLEGQIAIGTLLRRLPSLRLACDPEQLIWNRAFGLRGVMSLPVWF